MDQLQLPGDTVGLLLPLLDVTSIQRMRLSCSSWQQAIDQQLHTLRPVYLPAATPAVFSSCEAVHAPVVRRVEALQSQQTSLLTWQAPIRDLGSLSTAMGHAAVVDLSGQQLAPGSLVSHVMPLTRLRSLRLDACTLCARDLMDCLTTFAARRTEAGRSDQGLLTDVSLSGVQLKLRPMPGTRKPARTAKAEAEAAWLASELARVRAALAASDASSSAAAAPAAAAAHNQEATAGSKAKPDVWAGFDLGVDNVIRGCILLDLACNPLTKLELQGCVKDPVLIKAAGLPCYQQTNTLLIKGLCADLHPLCDTLVSLNILDNPFNKQDWQCITSQLTLLTELHCTWHHLGEDAVRPDDFSNISNLRSLSTLGLHFQGPTMTYEPYSLAPVATQLRALELSNSRCLQLLLSLTECSNMQQLKLQRISGPAAATELMVELLHSMPLLRELELSEIEGPYRQLDVARGWCPCCHLGDYLLSQLDCCCPHLTKLVLPDVDLNGSGLRLVSTSVPLAAPDAVSAGAATAPAAPPAAAAAAAAAGSRSSGASAVSSSHKGVAAWTGMPGTGGLRRLQHLEIYADGLMNSALPHFSCLTSLQSLTLRHMNLDYFTHACRRDCFRFTSALTALTSLRLLHPPFSDRDTVEWHAGADPGAQPLFDDDDDALQAMDGEEAAAAVAGADGDDAGLGGFPVHVGEDGEADGDLFFDAESDGSDANEEAEDSDSDSEGDSEEEGGQGAAAAPAAGLAGQLLQGLQQLQQMPGHLAMGALAMAPNMLGALANVLPQLQQAVQQAAALPAAAHADEQLQQALLQLWNGLQQQVPQQPDALLPGAGDGQVAGPAAAAAAGVPAVQPTLNAMEPRLNFLAGLRGLVTLDLSCLYTRGPCLVHLSSLTNLRSLSLANTLVLQQQSLDMLQQLQLPSVQHLSITGCSVETGGTQQQGQEAASGAQQPSAAAAAAATARPSSSSSTTTSSSSSSSRHEAARAVQFSLDKLVPLLCTAFPGVENLHLDNSSMLSLAGFATLLQRLLKLQRVWLSGGVGACPDAPELPHTLFASNLPTWRSRDSWQLPAQLGGLLMPYGSLQHAVQTNVGEYAWLLEQGLVLGPQATATAAQPPASLSTTMSELALWAFGAVAAAAAGDAAAATVARPPGLSSTSSPTLSAALATGAAALGTAATPRPLSDKDAATALLLQAQYYASLVPGLQYKGDGVASPLVVEAVPEGAVRVPFEPVEGLKYVCIGEDRAYVHHMGRMVRV